VKRYLFFYLTVFLIMPVMMSGKKLPADLPMENQLVMILTTITYDRKIGEEPGNRIKIGLFHTNRNPSKRYAESFAALFRKNYRDKTIRTKRIDFQLVTELDQLHRDPLHVIILAPDIDHRTLDRILEIAIENKITTASGITAYYNTPITLIVGVNDKKSFLRLNLDSAKNENCQFDSKVIQLSTIVENR